MTSEVFLDTAYAIALAVESDLHHERAEKLADQDEGFTAGWQAFIVLGQASMQAKPGEGTFDHPAANQKRKAFLVIGPHDRLQAEAKTLGDPIQESSAKVV